MSTSGSYQRPPWVPASIASVLGRADSAPAFSFCAAGFVFTFFMGVLFFSFEGLGVGIS
jgi:hypothetical protein